MRWFENQYLNAMVRYAFTTLIGFVHICSVPVWAQSIAPTSNQTFWEWHEDFLSHPENFIDQDEEGSLWQLHRRAMSHWVPRLAPARSLNEAQQALATYVEWIEDHPKSNTSFPSSWEEMGPFKTPYSNNNFNSQSNNTTGTGQIHNFAFDPNYATNGIMYACSPLGGLFKSTDRGDNWFSLTDNKLAYGGVADVAVDPTNGSRLFIATGNVDGFNNGLSIGVFRSLDGGETWQPINTNLVEGENYIGVHALEMHPTNPDILLCATNYGIQRTTNATTEVPTDVLWTGVSGAADNMYKSLFYHPGDPLFQTVYASGRDVYRSLDGGLTWESMTEEYPGLNLASINAKRIALGMESIPPYALHANICWWDEDLEFPLYPVNLRIPRYRNYAARFDQVAGTWTLHNQNPTGDEHADPGSFTSLTNNGPAWVCVAVRPGYNDLVVYGNTELFNSVTGGTVVNLIDGYSEEAHADKHALTYSPDGSELWIGCDGGAYMTDDVGPTVTNNAACVIQKKNKGLSVAWVLDVGCNPVHPQQVLIGTYDDSNLLHRLGADGVSHEWKYVDGGDGGAVTYSPDGSKAWTCSLNGRDYFTKYMANDPTTGPLDGGQYGFACDGCTQYLPDAEYPVDIPPMDFRPGSNQWTFAAKNLYVEVDQSAPPQDPGDFEQFSVTWFADLNDYYTQECLSVFIQRLAISTKDPDYIYFSTRPELVEGQGSACAPMKPSAIFASQRDEFGELLDWDHRFATLNMPSEWEDDPVAISALAVDPDDPLHIYVGFSGYNNELKVWEAYVDETDPEEFTYWSPLHTGQQLPNLPVTDLAFAEGTEHGLYVAFDVGIYYRNDETEWQPYFEALPNVQVADLEINYCTGKIRAGTTGRGLWESDLAEKPHLARKVETDETWAHHVNLGSDLLVTNGATLTISTTVNFAPGTRLIIDPGAHVVVENGGKLTNLCGEQWDGVEVRGNAGLSQDVASDQGRLELRAGAILERADIAVRLFGSNEQDIADISTTGGVVRSLGQSGNHVIIRDCKRGIWAKDYDYYQRSKIQYTTFETTLDGTIDHIRLESLHNFLFSHCSFLASGPDEMAAPIGIRSFDTRFTVEDCYFKYQSAGVRASDATLVKPCYLRRNTFDRCDRGITLNNVYNAEITDNSFLVPGGDGSWVPDPTMNYYPIPYGAYLYDCEGYEVEGNDLTGTTAHGNIGLLIRGSDQLPNEYSLNTFRKLYVGSQVQGYNRSPDDGLKFRCNQYGNADGSDGCVYDMALTTDDAAIAPVQGSMVDPAGNRFYPECTTSGDETDIYVDHQSSSGFLYFHHEDDFTTPDCITSSVIPAEAFGQSYDQNGIGTSCPEDPSHVISVSVHKSAFHAAAGPYTTLKAVYDGQVNGGNTADLVHMVADENISSFTLRNALLAASPRLNDSVVIPAILREPAMDEAHLVQVLLANSPLSADAGQAVKGSYVEELYTELWAQQQNHELRWASLVEAELSLLRVGAERSRHDYFRGLLEQDSTGTAMTSMDEVVNDTVVPATPMEQLALLIAQENWTEADERLADPSSYGLRNDQAEAMTVVRQIAADGQIAVAAVTDAETELRLFATDTRSQGHGVARCLLERFLNDTLQEPVILPSTERGVAGQQGHGSRVQTELRIEARPNPASAQLTVIIRGGKPKVGSYLTICDAGGRFVARIPIPQESQIVDLPVDYLANGLYRLQFFDGSVAVCGETISISR